MKIHSLNLIAIFILNAFLVFSAAASVKAVSSVPAAPALPAVTSVPAAPVTIEKMPFPSLPFSVKYSNGVKLAGNRDSEYVLRVEDLGPVNNNSGENGRTVSENGNSVVINGRVQNIGTLGGSILVRDINDSGVVVGEADVGQTTMYTDPNSHAFVWDGRMRDLGTLGGDTSAANAINNRNQIVGSARDENLVFYPVMWENDRVINIADYGHILSGGAVDVNERGQVIGTAMFEENVHDAFVWSGGPIKRLRSFKENYSARATAINDNGDISGFIRTFVLQDEDRSRIPRGKFNAGRETSKAVIWKNGELMDLNNMLPNNSGIKLFEAIDISNENVVTAIGLTREQDDYHKFLLTLPSNVPPTMEFIEPDEIFIPYGLEGELTPERPDRITIRWSDADPDNNARISLYYYRDNRDRPYLEDGGQLIASFKENRDRNNDKYIIDVSNFPPGWVFVYAVIDDGVSPPIKILSKSLERHFRWLYDF